MTSPAYGPKQEAALRVCLKCGFTWTEAVKHCPSCLQNWGEYNLGQVVISE